MADGLWTALSGLRVRQQRLDNLANRLANANTVGFRRQVHLSQEHRSSPEHVIVEQAPADMTLRHLPGDHVMVRAAGTQLREEEGVMNQTGSTPRPGSPGRPRLLRGSRWQRPRDAHP